MRCRLLEMILRKITGLNVVEVSLVKEYEDER